MRSVRASLTTLNLILVLFGSSSLTAVFAAAHPICTITQHDCGKIPTIKPCCCDQSNGSDQSGPVPGKASVGVSLVPIAAVFTPAAAPIAAGILVQAQASPPRGAPVDFPTLFASLLI